MVDPILVADLSAENHLPAGALRRALKAPASIAEPVLAVLDAAASEAELIEEDVNLLFWGVHVLAAARDSRAYAPLMRLLRQDGDSLEAILGDALITTLAKVVVSVFDGDVAPMHRLILDSTTDEFVRYELLTALVFLTHEGRIDRAQTHDLLVRFDDKRVSVEAEIGWTGWEEAIALLGFADLTPRVEAARKDGRITDEISDLPWFRTTLRQALAKPDDPSRFDPRRYGSLDDPIAELAWTAEDAGQPLRNPLKDVGRNDPCPCGSGKKFKKCCLGATPA